MRVRVTILAALIAAAAMLQIAEVQAAKKSKSNSGATPDATSQDPGDDTSQEPALDNLKDAPKAPDLVCSGAFAKDSSHARLVTEFGAKNVVFKDVATPGDVMVKASILFDADPTKRAVFFWRDVKNKANPVSIEIEAPSTWTGPGGLRNGLPLKELEKLNGGSFSMVAFGGVGGGTVSDLKGPFANVTGGCTLTARFEPGIANPLPPRYASITGDQTLVSTNFMLRRVRAQVTEWHVNY